MNKKTLKITTGAMVTAIFGVLLLLNRQTGTLLQDVFLFLYPIPMVAYAAMYGVKSSLPVLAAMSLLSFLFGDFTSIFYAVTQALIGLVFGGCLFHKVDMTKTLFVVMALSAVVSVLNTVVLGFLFGYDINQEIAEMQSMFNTAFEQAGAALPEGVLSTNYLKQMLIISMTLLGVLQGFVVYEVSLLILRRLRFPVQRPKSIFLYVPPKWSGYLAFAAFFLHNARMAQPMAEDRMQNVIMAAGIVGYLYLLCFGFLAVALLLKIHFPRIKALAYVLSFLGIMMFPFVELVIGFIYIVSRYHQHLLEQYFGPEWENG